VPDACSIVLRLSEANWYRLHGGTYVQGGEGSVEGSVELRNLTGAADHWRVAAEYGHLSSNNFCVEWRQPRAGGYGITVRLLCCCFFC
jgi:outer membrane protein insertion porin family